MEEIWISFAVTYLKVEDRQEIATELEYCLYIPPLPLVNWKDIAILKDN